MKGGDVLIFTKEDVSKETIKYKIDYIKHYNTVKEMINKEWIINLSPLENSIEDVVNKYNLFPGYKKRIEKYWIYAIALGERILWKTVIVNK